MSASRSSATGPGEPGEPTAAGTGPHDVYRRFLAASDEIGAAALRVFSSASGRPDPVGAAPDEVAASWARDAAAVIIDRIGAALLAGDTTVLLDHLSVELSDLRRTGISEAFLIALLDALSAALPEELGPAGQILAEGRAHLLRTGARPVRAVRPSDLDRPAPAATLPGQAFTDLLLLGALACQAPVALLSVPQPDGTWSTLAHGLETREGSNDGQLFQFVASSSQPVEITDLMTRLPRSPLVLPPHSLRWAYGTALRAEAGTVLGVVVVLDRWLREASKREQRAMVSLSRQLGAQLVQWIRPSGADPASPVRPMATAGRAAHPAGAVAAVSAPPGHRSVRVDSRPGPGGAGAPTSAAGGLVTTRHNLLRSQEVADIFDVTERTVINWAAAGKLPSLRTIGGHLRFRREDVLRLLSPSSDTTAG